MKVHLLLTLLVLSYSARAELLQPIELRLPTDEGAIYSKCAEAFQAALKDREDYENKPEVSLKCAYNIKGKNMKQLRDGFMSSCKHAALDMARNSSEGSIRVSVAVLLNAFNVGYGVIFRRDCLDASVASFHVNQAQAREHSQSYSGSASRSTGIREACSGPVGCQ